MGKVILDMSVSLDGFIRADNPRLEEPRGDGGQRLHAWVYGGEANRKVFADAFAGLGAAICGRTTYDGFVVWWGANGPSGSARKPVFVVTHEAPMKSPEDGVYTFVTGGIVRALEQAQAAAGDKVVAVMGGASVAQQYLAAALIDELSIHLVPVLFGSGTRMFGQLDGSVGLEPTGVIPTPEATHLRFRVIE